MKKRGSARFGQILFILKMLKNPAGPADRERKPGFCQDFRFFSSSSSFVQKSSGFTVGM